MCCAWAVADLSLVLCVFSLCRDQHQDMFEFLNSKILNRPAGEQLQLLFRICVYETVQVHNHVNNCTAVIQHILLCGC